MGGPKKSKKGGDRSKRVRSSTTGKIERMLEEVTRIEPRVAALRETWSRFTEKDMPEFYRWADETLRDERQELDLLTKKLDIYQAIIDEAREYLHYGEARTLEQAIDKAYRTAEDIGCFTLIEPVDEDDEDPSEDEADEDDLPSEAMDENLADALFDNFMGDVLGIDSESLSVEEYETYRNHFDESFRHVREGNRAGFESSMMDLLAEGQQGNKPSAKAAYRRLVKRLHPDHHGEFTLDEKKIWEDASTAYRALDTESLEILEVRLSIIRGEPIVASQTNSLRAYRDRLIEDQDFLREELEGANGHPAWEFSIREKTPAYLQSLRDGLMGALAAVRVRLDKLQTYVDSMRLSFRSRGAKKKQAKKKAATKKAPGKKAAKKKAAIRVNPAPVAPETAKPPQSRPRQDEFPF